jgi:phosphoenolpyruvate-protein kinase (PTS system EI component)
MKTISVNAAASKGIAIGKVFILKKPDMTPASYRTDPSLTEEEISRFESAAGQAALQIDKLAAGSEIFRAHSMLAQDAELKEKVCGRIRKGINAEQALTEVISEYTALLESQGDEYLKERSADLKDIRYRILRILKAVEMTSAAGTAFRKASPSRTWTSCSLADSMQTLPPCCTKTRSPAMKASATSDSRGRAQVLSGKRF